MWIIVYKFKHAWLENGMMIISIDYGFRMKLGFYQQHGCWVSTGMVILRNFGNFRVYMYMFITTNKSFIYQLMQVGFKGLQILTKANFFNSMLFNKGIYTFAGTSKFNHSQNCWSTILSRFYQWRNHCTICQEYQQL